MAPPDWTERLGSDADDLVALHTPDPFWAIGRFYRDFSQTSDDEVASCLSRAHAATADHPTPTTADPPSRDGGVEVRAGSTVLGGRLSLPEDAAGVVVFALGAAAAVTAPAIAPSPRH